MYLLGIMVPADTRHFNMGIGQEKMILCNLYLVMTTCVLIGGGFESHSALCTWIVGRWMDISAFFQHYLVLNKHT